MEIEKLQKKKETRSSLFKNINKINEPLARLRKIEKPQITNTRNEIGNIPDTEIIKKKYRREYYMQLYAHKYDNLEEMEQFLKNHKLPKFN